VQPETKYARLGRDRIAYQVLGQGPPDLVMTTGSFGHVDMAWEDPGIALFLRTLASFSRLVMFDRRGTGASDPLPLDSLPPWETYAETWLLSWTRLARSRRPCWPRSTPTRWRSSSPGPNRNAPVRSS
jgi:pimeloyl-ACP methyl ester carboxylesterase